MKKQDGIGEAVEYLRDRFPAPPDVAIVLGSGLGGFADALQDPVTIPSSVIPTYPRSTVHGHKGELVFGSLRERRILAVRGRVHLYETGSAGYGAVPHPSHRRDSEHAGSSSPTQPAVSIARSPPETSWSSRISST